MMDEHVSWIDHVRTVEDKIAINIGLLYRVSQCPNEDSLKIAYFSYNHSYFNYENIARVSTYATKLKFMQLYEKRDSRTCLFWRTSPNNFF